VPGPQVELRFRDGGPGVPSEIRGRVFEPFFTTRESGSGIGLAVASQTIRDHGGEIWLADSTRLDEGADFVVTLPLAAMVLAGDAGPVTPRLAEWLEQSDDPRRTGEVHDRR
jgi:two-component system NtrC family sensor kinase